MNLRRLFRRRLRREDLDVGAFDCNGHIGHAWETRSGTLAPPYYVCRRCLNARAWWPFFGDARALRLWRQATDARPGHPIT